LVWFQFIICVAILLIAGQKLARYSHILSIRTKLGGLWIGLILVSAITSVPETVAACAATALFNNPDLAISTLYGGNTFNLALIAVMDIIYAKRPLLKMVGRRQMRVILGGVLLLGIAGLAIIFRPLSEISLGGIGVVSIVLLVLYSLMLYQQQRSAQPDTDDGNDYLEYTLRSLTLKFSGAAVVVILAGFWLAYIGNRIVEETALPSSFVGNLFLGVSTSAPEMIVSLAALRIGAIELAVANLTGSVLYRSAIIILPDLFYPHDPVLSVVSSGDLVIIGAAILMSLIVIGGLRWPGPRKALGVASWYSPFLLAIYFGTFYLLLI